AQTLGGRAADPGRRPRHEDASTNARGCPRRRRLRHGAGAHARAGPDTTRMNCTRSLSAWSEAFLVPRLRTVAQEGCGDLGSELAAVAQRALEPERPLVVAVQWMLPGEADPTVRLDRGL